MPSGEARAGGAGVRILIVDDHAGVLQYLRAVLAAQRYDVTSAGGGAEAVALLERGDHFDIVMSDLHMPEVDGREVLRVARERLPQSKRVIITAYVTESGCEDLQRECEARVLPKPFTPEDIQKLLVSLTGDRSSITETRSRRAENTKLVTRRCYERLPLYGSLVEIRKPDGKPLDNGRATGDDISEVGIGIITIGPHPVDEPIRLIVAIEFFSDTIEGEGIVVWCADSRRILGRYRVGIKWTRLAPGHFVKIQQLRRAMRTPEFQQKLAMRLQASRSQNQPPSELRFNEPPRIFRREDRPH
ncbi:MAG: response regulator [Planctomycetes bacterium]|nr:response regulator [Planctomycetota bacterium]